MMTTLTLVLLLAGAGKGSTETFVAPFEDVWTASLSTVAEEFTIENSNRADGTISFRSNTYDCSALLVKRGEKETAITVNAKSRRGGGFGISVKGPAEKIKRRFFDGVRKKLAPQ